MATGIGSNLLWVSKIDFGPQKDDLPTCVVKSAKRRTGDLHVVYPMATTIHTR